MKKILVLLFVLVLILSVCGCADSTTKAEKDSITSKHTSSDEITTKTSKITEKEAIEIASQYWGIKSGDKDEETGYPYLITPAESSNDNIVIALKWLVENSHYSTVDSIEIDPYTGKL